MGPGHSLGSSEDGYILHMTAQETRDRASKGGWEQARGRDPPATSPTPLGAGVASAAEGKCPSGPEVNWDRDWRWKGDRLCDGEWPWKGILIFLAEGTCSSWGSSWLGAHPWPLAPCSLWLRLFHWEGRRQWGPRKKSPASRTALTRGGGRQGANYGMYFLSRQLGKVLPAARLCLCFFGLPRVGCWGGGHALTPLGGWRRTQSHQLGLFTASATHWGVSRASEGGAQERREVSGLA